MARWHLLVIPLLLLAQAGCVGHGTATAEPQADGEPLVWSSRVLEKAKRDRPVTEPEKKALATQGTIPFRLEKDESEETRVLLQYFSLDKRPTMETWLRRAAPHLRLVQAVLASYNLPPDLVVVPFIESGYSPMAYSPVGAGGMWQFMPETARRFGLTVDWWLDERRDPVKSTVAAAKYLAKLHQLFGDWNLALAAYNAGEGKVSRAMAASGQCDFFDLAKDPTLLKEETRRYVPRFLAMLKIFQNLDTLGFGRADRPTGPALATLQVPGGTDLLALSRACGLGWEQFQALNPAFRRQVSPPDAASTVAVPASQASLAQAFLLAPPGPEGQSQQTVAARAGETWEAVARRAGMPVAALRRLNAALPEALDAGQPLRVAHHATRLDAGGLIGERASCPADLAAAKPARRSEPVATATAIAGKYEAGSGGASEWAAWRPTATAWTRPFGIPGRDAPPGATAVATAPEAMAATPLPGGTYTVRPGETLYSICQRLGLDAKALVAANKQALTRLRPGDVLTIPGPDKAAPAPTRPPRGLGQATPPQPARPKSVALTPYRPDRTVPAGPFAAAAPAAPGQ
ncbi:MAG: transglycosylase SLT domain-containing protein [Solidesulfovibrio sp. DCME]|uniref:LysM peptidoglycan-binding domain-containing protein n=1 Tax=Solidesulfovibrio sp. DCME TaxID=3447380 RepID=UPI003D1040DD